MFNPFPPNAPFWSLWKHQKIEGIPFRILTLTLSPQCPKMIRHTLKILPQMLQHVYSAQVFDHFWTLCIKVIQVICTQWTEVQQDNKIEISHIVFLCNLTDFLAQTREKVTREDHFPDELIPCEIIDKTNHN